MRTRMNRKAMMFIPAGILTSGLSLYLLWSYIGLAYSAFLLGCVTYVVGIVFFANAPIDGFVGKWLIPLYCLSWTFMNWHVFDVTTKRLGPLAGEGLDSGIFLIGAQVFGIGMGFVPKVQRVLRYRLSIFLIAFFPIALIILIEQDKMGYFK